MGAIAAKFCEAGAKTFQAGVTLLGGYKEREALKKAQKEARQMHEEKMEWEKEKFAKTLGYKEKRAEEEKKKYWNNYRQEVRRYKENKKRARMQNLENRFKQWVNKNQTNTQAAIELSRMS